MDLRVCMDGIFRHTAQVCGGMVLRQHACSNGVPGFDFHDLPERETIKARMRGAKS